MINKFDSEMRDWLCDVLSFKYCIISSNDGTRLNSKLFTTTICLLPTSNTSAPYSSSFCTLLQFSDKSTLTHSL